MIDAGISPAATFQLADALMQQARGQSQTTINVSEQVLETLNQVNLDLKSGLNEINNLPEELQPLAKLYRSTEDFMLLTRLTDTIQQQSKTLLERS
jgi:hypothetical protein